MEAFCGGDTFWNTTITWGDDQSYPDFTECFQNSVLIWISSGWLWLTCPFYLPYLLSQKSDKLPNSWKIYSKLCFAVLQLIIIVIELVYGSSQLAKNNETFLQAYFVGPAIEAVTIVLVIFYIELERRKGFITSGILFIYWLLANITYIIPFYRKIIKKGYKDIPEDFALFNVYYLFSLIQLVLSCIAEKLPVIEGKRPCPETQASFLSRITFHWIQRLVVTGYKNPLTEADLFTLNSADQSKTVVDKFEANWRREEAALERKLANARKEDSIGSHGATIQDDGDLTETTPLLGIQNTKSTYRSADQSATDAKNRISLLRVLTKTFGWDLLVSNIWKLIFDILVFVNPFLLQLLIDFAEDYTKPSWKGYIYSVAFFVVITIQSFTFHALLHHGLTVGIRVRAALISTIFKKSLRMSNKSRNESTIGEVVNMMSVDAEHIKELTGFLWGLWSGPLQMIGAIVFLYFTVGNATFVGVGVIVLMFPLNAVLLNKLQKYQTTYMEHKDQRIKLMTEILNGIKILKLYAWEMVFGDKVTDVRKQELAVLLKADFLYSISTLSWTVAPFTVGLATFATYIYLEPTHRFNPQTAFVAMTLFNILRFAMNFAPIVVIEFVKAIVSVRRMEKFLNNEDLDVTNVSYNPSDSAISIINGNFSWDKELGTCLHNINMKIEKGSLVAIVGTVGAGKSSLISAMLGEMNKTSGQVNVDGTVAYVPQQAWIQNATVKDNIMFGQAVNTKYYNEIVEACALKSDLDILPAGDMTEIGEKGINLSGGQRQRVSLARAMYFNSDIYLLDDPLSAVDSHVGKHIFENVVGENGLLKNKTRILVTHGIHWLPKVDVIYVLSDGEISEVGSYEELLSHAGAFAKFLQTYLVEQAESDNREEDEEEHEMKEKILQRLVSIQSDSDPDLVEKVHLKRSRSHKGSESDKGHRGHSEEHRSIKREVSVKEEKMDKSKLIEEEELETGNVKFSVFLAYARAVGYKWSLMIIVWFGLYEVFSMWSSIWLTDWTSDQDLLNLTHWPANSTERKDKNNYYLAVYGTFGVAQAVMVTAYSIVSAIRCVRAAKILHENMLTNVLRGPMWFFDTTPVGRIVNRFSQDVEAVDSDLPNKMLEVLYSLFSVLAVLIIITYSTPIFLTLIIPVGVIYLLLQRFYIPTSRQLKRLESKTRSPIYNNFSESLLGASVIRAFRVQDRFISESEQRVDYNQEYNFANNTINRWLGFRLEVIGAVIVLGASLFSVIERDNINAALVGLSVSYALQITDNLNWLVRMVSEFETDTVSVERINQYAANPTEAPLHTSHLPSTDWPDKGHIEIQSLSTRYRKGLDLVLKDINVLITPGEKIGIVGRTGAGKSSFTLSLFRLIEPSSGKIVIDGEDISHLGLCDLRSKLTILPQEPVLFSGTLRLNLDPLEHYNDADIWVALEHAHLKLFVEGLPTKLEYEVGEGGQNLSVGQRQLMCLARSLLRKSKILVLDEATAAVDLETDSLIQNTISNEFNECTVLTIAHRLNTVMDYNRILVLSEGEIKEFDSPQVLLSDSNSAFYAMAKDSGLV